MSAVEFKLNNSITTIKCINNETMDDICKKFLKKYFIDTKKLNFYYSGNKVDFNSTFSQTIHNSDKNKKLIKIEISENIENNEENHNFVKASQIICPMCSENCKISFKKFKINLFGCGNGHHTNNILFEEFEKTQNINISEFNCNVCKKKLEINSEINKIYLCMNCNSNFCFKCRLEHGKTHDFINYKEKNYICKTHNRFYDSYCQTCKKNICIICYQEHLNHNIKSYGYMLPKTTEFSNSFINLGDKVNSLKKI